MTIAPQSTQSPIQSSNIRTTRPRRGTTSIGVDPHAFALLACSKQLLVSLRILTEPPFSVLRPESTTLSPLSFSGNSSGA